MEAPLPKSGSGCYDCLRAGLTITNRSGDATYGTDARAGAIRLPSLLAVRETELGLVPGATSSTPVRLGPVGAASPELPALVEIAEVIASGPTGFTRSATTDKAVCGHGHHLRRQEQWASVLLNLMPQDFDRDALAGWVLRGTVRSTFHAATRRTTSSKTVAELPLITCNKRATACGLIVRAARGAAR